MKSVLKSLWEMLTVPITDSVSGWGIIVCLWLLILILSGLVVYGLLDAINSLFLPIRSGRARVVAMYFEPSHHSTIILNGKTPMRIWHPDAWKLVLRVNRKCDDFYLTRERYLRHRVGEIISITYTTGRLWKSISIQTAIV